jgi:hypothetical protein
MLCAEDVAKTAAQTAVVLVLLDLLRITRNAPWLEEQGACHGRRVRRTARRVD